MKIAVMSDLHDNLRTWELIVSELKNRGIGIIINCGDTASPAMLMEISKTFPGAIHTVFGNVADKPLETEKVKEMSNVKHYGEAGEIELSNRKIFFNHYPDIARDRAHSGNYDLCCYGHDHTKRAEQLGRTLLLNPGTAGGMFQYPSIAVVDLETMASESVDLKL